MDPVLYYIYKYEGTQRNILIYLHELIHTFPEIKSKLNYGLPFYYINGWICYQRPLRDKSVELCFFNSEEITDPFSLLESKGRKHIKSIVFRNISDIPEDSIFAILQEIILYDKFFKQGAK